MSMTKEEILEGALRVQLLIDAHNWVRDVVKRHDYAIGVIMFGPQDMKVDCDNETVAWSIKFTIRLANNIERDVRVRGVSDTLSVCVMELIDEATGKTLYTSHTYGSREDVFAEFFKRT